MSSPFGPPPTYIDLKESATAGNDAAVIVLVIIATVAVLCRLWARKVQYLALVADDYFVIIALVFVYASTGLSISSGFYGSGKHVWIASTTDIVVIVKILYSYTFIYAASTSFTKLSIIFLYRRVFGNTSRIFDICLHICTFLTVGYAVMIWGTMLGSCRPIPYFWYRFIDPTAVGTCINVNEFFLIAGVINMVLDLIILTVPIPKILKLQMSRRRKLTVVGIMLLGSFVCVASIVRIYYLVVLQTAIDLTWIMGPVFIWSSVEPAIGILSACLPVMRPLIRILFGKYIGSKTGTNDLELSGEGKFRGGKSHTTIKNSEWPPFEGRLRPDEDELRLTNDVTADSYSTGSRGGGEGEEEVPAKSIMVRTNVVQTASSL